VRHRFKKAGGHRHALGGSDVIGSDRNAARERDHVLGPVHLGLEGPVAEVLLGEEKFAPEIVAPQLVLVGREDPPLDEHTSCRLLSSIEHERRGRRGEEERTSKCMWCMKICPSGH
jgi:hypothetical protein